MDPAKTGLYSSLILLLLFFLFLPLPLFFTTVSSAGSGYSISVEGGTDIYDRTLSYEGEKFVVSQIADVREGETLKVKAEGPSGTLYRVNLYDSSRNDQDRKTALDGGSETFEFPTDGYSAGTYLAAIYQDGDFKAIQPFIVSGYDVELKKVVRDSGRLKVNFTISPLKGQESPYGSKVVLIGENSRKEVKGFHLGGERYTCSVSLTDLSPGDYQLFAGALGTDSFRGKQEVLGLSGVKTVSIGSQSGGRTGGGGPSSSGSGLAPVEDPGNIRATDVEYMVLTSPGEKVNQTFRDPGENFSVEKLEFVYGVKTNEVRLQLEELKGPTTLRKTNPPGEIFLNFNLYAQLPFRKNLEEATIFYQVEKSWLERNGFEPGQVSLARWNKSTDSWNVLEAEKDSTSSNKTLFKSDVPWFTQFAVTAVENSKKSSEKIKDNKSTTKKPGEGNASPTDTEIIHPNLNQSEDTGPEPGPTPVPGFEFITAPFAVLVASLIRRAMVN